jgi:hypothetical protein
MSPVNWWILVFVALVCFLEAEFHGFTHGSSVVTLRTFIFIVICSICFIFWPCLPVGLGVLGRFFPLHFSYHTCHCQVGHRNITVTVWVKYRFSNIVSLFILCSFEFQAILHARALVCVCVCVCTCNITNTNRYLLKKQQTEKWFSFH